MNKEKAQTQWFVVISWIRQEESDQKELEILDNFIAF